MSHLRVVQPGEPEPDAAIVAALEEMLALAKKGELIGLFAAYDTHEIRQTVIRCEDGLIGLMAFGQECCRDVLRQALGLE